MNPITFNEEIKIPSDFFIASDDRKTITRTLPDDVLKAPIFVWDDLEDDRLLSLPDHSDVRKLLETQPNLLPFRSLRLYVRSNLSDGKDGTKGFKAWLHHANGILTARVAMQGPKKLDSIYHISTCVGNDGIEMAFRNGNNFASRAWLDAHPILKDQQMACMTSLAWFIREASSPSNFIASVSPDKMGKSIEWMKTRTHYVILHKAHPANNRDVKTGSSVAPNSTTLKRQAHSRRAHARILRSPRFRHKVGQTIRVKACWIGPDEWKQFGSIYRMSKFSSANVKCDATALMAGVAGWLSGE